MNVIDGKSDGNTRASFRISYKLKYLEMRNNIRFESSFNLKSKFINRLYTDQSFLNYIHK